MSAAGKSTVSNPCGRPTNPTPRGQTGTAFQTLRARLAESPTQTAAHQTTLSWTHSSETQLDSSGSGGGFLVASKTLFTRK